MDHTEIHKKVIDTMERIGYRLLKDGETFYQNGYEIDLNLGIKFSMHQAYEIHHRIKLEVEKAVKKLKEREKHISKMLDDGQYRDGYLDGIADCIDSLNK